MSSTVGPIRPAMACIQCRTAKVKCEGTMPAAFADFEESSSLSSSGLGETAVRADANCPRCQRLQLTCTWRQNYRAGRPPGRKRMRSDLTKPGADDVTLPVDFDFWPSLAAEGNKNDLSSEIDFFDSSSPVADGESLMLALRTQSFDNLFRQLVEHDDSPYIPPAAADMEPQIQASGANAMLNSGIMQANSQQSLDSEHQALHNDIAALRNRVKRQPCTVRGSLATNLESGARRTSLVAEQGVLFFWRGLSNAIPLFASPAEFHEALQCSTYDHIEAKSVEVLLSAVSTLGFALFEGRDSSNFARMRRLSVASLDEVSRMDLGIVTTNCLIRMTAGAILICYASFGCGEMPELDGQKKIALRLAQMAHLDSIGSTPPDNDQNRSTTQSNLQGLARQTYWELQIVDYVFDVATSGQVKKSTSVNLTNDRWPEPDDDIHPDMKSMWSLRGKTARLLYDCVHSRILSEAEPLLSLNSADTLCANMIAEAELALLKLTRSSTMLRRQDHGQQFHLESAARQCQTVLFDCLVMLHVSRLHLHRVTWFADIPMGMTSCGFQRAEGSLGSTFKAGVSSSGQSCIDARFDSVEKISKAASSILMLLQSDTDAFFKRNFAQEMGKANLTMPLIPIHWPIIGCCQMAASYGLFVNFVSQDDDDAEADQQIARSNDQGAFDANALSLAVRRKREFISGMKLTAALLDQMNTVWGISSRFLDQLRQCRKAVIFADNGREKSGLATFGEPAYITNDRN